MTIKIIAIGKIKETYFTSAINEYIKRLKPFTDIEVNELLEAKLPLRHSPAQIDQALQKEAEDIQKRIRPDDFTIALDLDGAPATSETFAKNISELMIKGHSSIVFIIGSSHGLDQKLKKTVNQRLKLSDLTFPHQLVRVLLLEQIYRAYKIINHEPYHK